MSDLQKPTYTESTPSPSMQPSSNGVSGMGGSSGSSLKGELPPKIHYPNPPESTIPDPSTLREQWRFAIRQYSKWYSQAWGTAILAGGAFFALGWIIKGSNPLPSLQSQHQDGEATTTAADAEQKPSSSHTK